MRKCHRAGLVGVVALAIAFLAGPRAAAQDDAFPSTAADSFAGGAETVQPTPGGGGLVVSPVLTGQADPEREGEGASGEEVPYCDVVVRAPDGQPVDGAAVFITRRSIALVLQDNVPVPVIGMLERRTEGGGKFVLPLVEDHGYVFAVHPSGCAEMTVQEAFDAQRIDLQPYGRVEGVVRVGDRPGAGLNVALSYDVIPPRGTGRVHPMYRTVTDADGRFAFDRAPAGLGRVAIERSSPWGQVQPSHARPVDIVSGETVETVLGGSGRPVVGRIKAPVDPQSLRPWAVEHASIVPLVRVTVADAEQDLAKYRNRQAYYVDVKPNGVFRADDVEAGKYRLTARIREAIDGSPVKGRVMGKLEHVFTVPEMSDGREDEPLDLGALTFESVPIVEKAWR